MSSEWNDKRPMSPHLQIWRWHGAMMSSIVHRASAIISYVALCLVSVFIFVIFLTGTLPLEKIIFSPLGAIGLFVFLFAFLFLALAQFRHWIWSRGNMFEAEANNKLSYVMLGASIVLSLVLTLVATGVFS